MESAVLAGAQRRDVVVMAAAVADFRPSVMAPDKIKKSDGVPAVVLEPTTDILAALGAGRRDGQVIVGFAAETGHPGGGRDELRRLAHGKLEAKRADLIVANDVAAPGVGFAHDTNAVLIVGRDGEEIDVPLAGKDEIARRVVDALSARLRRSPARPPERSGEPEASRPSAPDQVGGPRAKVGD
jgi:phosphopantothenoylcysteine decarboxylase/phosphopantothenate--cysteine ligase